MKTEQATIAEMTTKANELTYWYLSLLKEVDVDKEFEIEGVKLNSVYWLTAHLCNTADMLTFSSTGIENKNAPSWLSGFGLGMKPEEATEKPPFSEVLNYLKDINSRAIEVILQLSEEQLNEDNKLNISFGGDRSVRTILYHQIRHQACHAGHLGWLCKLNGIATI